MGPVAARQVGCDRERGRGLESPRLQGHTIATATSPSGPTLRFDRLPTVPSQGPSLCHMGLRGHLRSQPQQLFTEHVSHLEVT